MENLDNEIIEETAKGMLESMISIQRPISYIFTDKKSQKDSDIYWEIHGKSICKHKLINYLEALNNIDKLHCVIKSTQAYLFNDKISRTTKLIAALEKL